MSRPSGVTHYQQKWKAKSTTRAYHGEQIREKHWQRMFRSRLRAEIPMDTNYLARYDGSELAAGRGSGREMRPKDALDLRTTNKKSFRIPYMHMTYAPMERRLDTAVFRALFASSARQARQFVIHGKVKVNGKKMPYPGYMLNPGDMFSVDPESVLFATGAPKDQEAIRIGRRLKRVQQHEARQEAEAQKAAEIRRTKALEAKHAQEEEENSQQEADAAALKQERENLDEAQLKKVQRKQINELVETAQVLIRDTQNEPSAKRKVELRSFVKSAKTVSNKMQRKDPEQVDKEIEELVTSFAKLTPSPPQAEAAKREAKALKAAAEEKEVLDAEFKKEYQKSLDAIMQARYAATDESKPYATPWRPRNYMSAFAFIPQYLEVNQNICAAVYLRHPVAKPNAAEVPSPFGEDVQQLAFSWYLRRR
ncbi:hypothetical protein BP6252_04297 [Coleophoma cylindrospora]|uniref:Small ribosomal subunit protein uS4m n=1 Tax=Coleophoma cylindrospora TaxID=1849047 RepID=A0A3D8S039_9HELO|nr:hypothetical protein BP6252_04297 [Coleophoma cylindrospora]